MGKTRHAISQYLLYDPAAAHRKLHARLNEKLKDLGVQVETWRVLETLGSDEGRTMGELAEIVLMNPPTLTKLVDRMVANGLVQRQLAPEDHRRVHLVLTGAGVKLIGKIRRHVDAHNEDILERLGEENARIVRDALRTLSRRRCPSRNSPTRGDRQRRSARSGTCSTVTSWPAGRASFESHC